MYALSNRHTSSEILKKLIHAGATFDHHDKWGKSVIEQLSPYQDNFFEISQCLLRFDIRLSPEQQKVMD